MRQEKSEQMPCNSMQSLTSPPDRRDNTDTSSQTRSQEKLGSRNDSGIGNIGTGKSQQRKRHRHNQVHPTKWNTKQKNENLHHNSGWYPSKQEGKIKSKTHHQWRPGWLPMRGHNTYFRFNNRQYVFEFNHINTRCKIYGFRFIYFLLKHTPRWAHVCTPINKYIPKKIMDKYNIWGLEVNGFVYMEVMKGMYGLPQAGRL